ncbi:hypothetical protein ACIBL3_47260, partial [Kribbella sp. NPDC050124]|uniref:hypothetical protein n=1 Tax=Kribbella sp. NPDC050124 TaxID=3364114 RepID=UPI003792C8E9
MTLSFTTDKPSPSRANVAGCTENPYPLADDDVDVPSWLLYANLTNADGPIDGFDNASYDHTTLPLYRFVS